MIDYILNSLTIDCDYAPKKSIFSCTTFLLALSSISRMLEREENVRKETKFRWLT